MKRHFYNRNGCNTYTYEWEVYKENEEGNLYTFDVDFIYFIDGDIIEIEIDKIRLTAAQIDGNDAEIIPDLSKRWEILFKEYVDSNWDKFYGILMEEVRVDTLSGE